MQPSSVHLTWSQPITGRSSRLCSRRRFICPGLSRSPAVAAGSTAVVFISVWDSANHRPRQLVSQPSFPYLPGSQPIIGRSSRFCSRRCPISLGLSQSPAAVAGSAAIVDQSDWSSANLLPHQPVSQPSLVDLTWFLPITGRSSRFHSRRCPICLGLSQSPAAAAGLQPSSVHLTWSQPITGRSSRLCSRRRFICPGLSRLPAVAAGSTAVVFISVWDSANHRPRQPVPQPSFPYLPGSQC